jgi:hypothetical protein
VDGGLLALQLLDLHLEFADGHILWRGVERDVSKEESRVALKLGPAARETEDNKRGRERLTNSPTE